VPTIVPILEREFRSAQEKLVQTVQELSELDVDKLKEKGRNFYSNVRVLSNAAPHTF
jgi:hypothetical protein